MDIKTMFSKMLDTLKSSSKTWLKVLAVVGLIGLVSCCIVYFIQNGGLPLTN